MLTIIGMGPGKKEGMTIEAYHALKDCDCIVGYTVYVELVRGLFPDKEYYATPMTAEVERCRWAIGQAAGGRNVAMVCSGDSGVYGMAGLVCELMEESGVRCGDGAADAGAGKDGKQGQETELELRILPGVTAACSGAAVLGAPLAHDFAVISLSDRLTPWEKIERRLQAAAMGDFVICLYNPASRTRPDYLQKACDILLQSGYMEEDRICGVVRNIGRDGQERQVMTLGKLREFPADMFTTVYIGNQMTKQLGGRMVTPRGYRKQRL